MATPKQDEARLRLKKAIREAGGVVKVAAAANIPQTHLSSITSGKRGMGKDAASKLRPWISLSAEDWVDLLAPVEGDGGASADAAVVA